MVKSAVSGLLAVSLATTGIDPAQAQTPDLAFGKHRASAAFPCSPELSEQPTAKLPSGSEIVRRALTCTQGGHTYSLTAMEYPPPIGMGMFSLDVLLEGDRGVVAGKANVKIKSTRQMTHQGFQAIRVHALDSRVPAREFVIVVVFVDRSVLGLSVVAKPGSLQAANQATFARSLKISRAD